MAKRNGVSIVPWDKFQRRVFDWRQGEHVSIVGRTGSGKTTLATNILPERRYTVVFATKPRDPLIGTFKKQGYEIQRTWRAPHIDGNEPKRIVLWPKFDKVEDVANQRKQIASALGDIFTAGNWTTYMDEAYWITKELNLGAQMRAYWQQGRSLGLSVVAGTQRPVNVPIEMWTQATHVFMFRMNNYDDLRRLAGIGVWDPHLVTSVVPRLKRFEALYLNTVESIVAITKPPAAD